MRVTSYNRGHIHSTLFETKPNSDIFPQESSCFHILYSQALQIYQFYLGGDSWKALHTSLSFKHLEQKHKAVKFGVGLVWASDKMTRCIPGKLTVTLGVTHATPLIRDGFSFRFTVTNFVKFTPLSEQEMPYFWRFQVWLRVKCHVCSGSATCLRSLTEPKESKVN